MIVQINTDGIDYYQAEAIAKLLLEINIILKVKLTVTTDYSVNMEREITEHVSKNI